MICNIDNRQPRRDYAKPRIERCELAQKRLLRRLSQYSLSWTRWVLEWLQPWIWISKPSQRSVKKFVCGRNAPTTAQPKAPAKNQFSRTIMFGSYPLKPMVDERRLPDTNPGNYCNDIYTLVCPCIIQ